MTIQARVLGCSLLVGALVGSTAHAEQQYKMHSDGAPAATVKKVRMGAARLISTLKGYGYLAQVGTPAARRVMADKLSRFKRDVVLLQTRNGLIGMAGGTDQFRIMALANAINRADGLVNFTRPPGEQSEQVRDAIYSLVQGVNEVRYKVWRPSNTDARVDRGTEMAMWHPVKLDEPAARGPRVLVIDNSRSTKVSNVTIAPTYSTTQVSSTRVQNNVSKSTTVNQHVTKELKQKGLLNIALGSR